MRKKATDNKSKKKTRKKVGIQAPPDHGQAKDDQRASTGSRKEVRQVTTHRQGHPK